MNYNWREKKNCAMLLSVTTQVVISKNKLNVKEEDDTQTFNEYLL